MRPFGLKAGTERLLPAQLTALPLLRFLVPFLIIYVAAILCIRTRSFRDPSSWVFNPRSAYAHDYSDFRLEQALDFVNNASTAPPFLRNADSGPEVCVGIPSIAREGARYLRLAFGSLLQGLAQEERDKIHLGVLIANTDPNSHPAYHEPWLANLADDIWLYDLPQEEFDHIASLEKDRGLFREKALFDQIYILRACYATGAELIVKLEDDILAMDGWFHRTIKGAQIATRKSTKMNGGKGYLYMRLFHTEEYLGWNSEDWMTHTSASLMFVASVAAVLTILRNRFASARRYLTSSVMVAACRLAAPAFILLFFAAGRVTVFPLPPGVNLMNNYGCCAQGQVFPRDKVPGLIEFLQNARIGFIDTLTEAYADEHDELRWALTPSVVQHIGERSSKSDDPADTKYKSFGFTVSHKLWSFPFEEYDPVSLHQEHQAAIEAEI